MKNTIILKYLSYISSVFLFIEGFGLSPFKIMVLTILMVLDVITGILKSYFCKGGTSIRSKALYAGICAKMLIILLPIIIQIAGLGMGVNFNFLVNVLFILLIGNELYSFINNTLSIHLRKNLKEYDSLGIILKVLRDYILSFLEITRVSLEKDFNKPMEVQGEIEEEKKKKSKKI